MVWKLTLCYDGSPFAGWQVQPGRPTVQGELQAAIYRVTGEQTLPQGSGRTDAGVHALGQVASVSLRAPIPPANLVRALNYTLPAAIRILAAEYAPAGFHARHSARAKTYEYRISQEPLCLPWHAPYVCRYTFPLDFEAMQQGARLVLGTHDFRSFQAHEPDASARAAGDAATSTVRTVMTSAWTQTTEQQLVYTVRGSGFLHHMVRNLVGTFLAIGRGQIAPEAVEAILAARDRSAAGPTAPASGLWLHSVEYDQPESNAAARGETVHSPMLR